jgi:transposase
MTSSSQQYQHIIAFEVAKDSLTLHILPDDTQERIANTPAAVRRVLRRQARRNGRHALGPMLVVCEATGSYDRHVLAVACELAIPLHRAHGVRTRHFARYLGLAKTDPIDARMLALFGRDTAALRLYSRPAASQVALRELRKRRDELKAMAYMEANRLEHACLARVRASIRVQLRRIDKEVAAIETAIDQMIEADPAMAHKTRLMQSLKGIGPATATACLAYLPELGSFTKAQVARITGLAPIANDSGKSSAPRHIHGGRKSVRNALYMAALVAIAHNPRIRLYAIALKKRGKPAKLVITAVMRKLIIILNAIIRDDAPALKYP